ncbi:hypothetical protein FQN57_002883 [Myotisia sp. PD_48]|nr:hypothetical protein FQN57_002883 [Myotisia sp. PD_48]
MAKSRKVSPKTSPYFTRKRPDVTSCLRFPPLSAASFGLIQEKLADDPFRLLLATIFLNRTKGEAAIPALYSVLERYPTIESLAEADADELVPIIRHLGFQNLRARKCITVAQNWLQLAPESGKRYRRLHYPNKSDGLDIKPREVISDDDVRVAWEVAHLYGIGDYGIDSWRIFCRDVLRGLATDWNGAGAKEDFIPEWKSVHPKDKELCSFLTWMWLKEGWIWDPKTGEKIAMTKRVSRAVRKGGLVLQKSDGVWLLDMVSKEGKPNRSINVATGLVEKWTFLKT